GREVRQGRRRPHRRAHRHRGCRGSGAGGHDLVFEVAEGSRAGAPGGALARGSADRGHRRRTHRPSGRLGLFARTGMPALRRFLQRLTESDEERLAEELRAWAASVPGTVRIADAKPRSRVRVAGMVRRITVLPVDGFEAMEVMLTDGTGELAARWLGRRTIPGLGLGSRLVVEGVRGLASVQGSERIG